MASDADLDRIARSLPGVTVGRYWDDDRAYLMERAHGGRGLAQRRSLDVTRAPLTPRPANRMPTSSSCTPRQIRPAPKR